MSITKDVLTKMLELPHRQAGTDMEEKAGDYLKNVYAYFKLQANEYVAPSIRNSFTNHLIISFSLIILTLIINFFNILVLSFAFFIITVLVYLRAFGLPFNFVKKPSRSKSIFVDLMPSAEVKNTIVVTARYDTGNDYSKIFSFLKPIYKIFNSGYFLTNPIPEVLNNPMVFSNLAIAITLLSILIPDPLTKLFFATIVIIPLGIGIYLLSSSKKTYPKGIYSNGIGTAMLVEMATEFAQAPLDNTRVIFVNTSASETLTKNTAKLLKTLNLDKASTFILDLDCIGEDRVTLIGNEPQYPLGLDVPYDSTFMTLIDFTDEYFNGDYSVINSPLPTGNQDLVFNGYRVMGLITTTPQAGISNKFQNGQDRLDNVNWDSVEKVKVYVTEYLRFIDDISKEVTL